MCGSPPHTHLNGLFPLYIPLSSFLFLFLMHIFLTLSDFLFTQSYLPNLLYLALSFKISAYSLFIYLLNYIFCISLFSVTFSFSQSSQLLYFILFLFFFFLSLSLQLSTLLIAVFYCIFSCSFLLATFVM